jgi:hypothetical protein
VILREFLPGLIGPGLAAELLARGPQLYRIGDDRYIPFEFGDAAYRYGHAHIRDRYRSNPRLPAPLIALPTQVSGSAPGTDYASLANRDLQRGQAVGLPSGEAIADRLGVPALSVEEVGLANQGWTGETPLWFYILKEADVLHDGDRLGPVGGRIVGEVLVGIIDADPGSFRSVAPDWTPTLPARRPGAFGLADILVPG